MLLNENDLPTIEALQERWRQEAPAIREFVASLTDDDLNRTVRYKTTKGLPSRWRPWPASWSILSGQRRRSM